MIHGVANKKVQSIEMRLENKKSWISFVFLLLFYVIGIIYFATLESKTFIDSLYVSTVTLATIGFGDIKPEDKEHRLLFTFWIGFGILLFGTCINVVLGSSLKGKKERWIQKAKERREKRIQDTHSNIRNLRGMMNRQKGLHDINQERFSEAEYILFHLEKNGDVKMEKILVSVLPF